MDEKIIFSRGTFFQGTTADLTPGDSVTKGFLSHSAARTAKYVYCAGTLDAAVWGAEVAAGDGRYFSR